MIVVVLLAVAAAVASLAPRALVNRPWVDRSPVLGLAAWYAALFSVTAALALAALALVIPWPRTVDVLCALGSWCAEALRGQYGMPGHVAGALVVGVVLLVAGRTMLVVVRAARAVVAGRRRHRDAVALVGTHLPGLGVTVLDHTDPAAYLVPGRRRRIVVTTAALALLSAGELAAVVAHERAHATGRHHLLRDGARLLEQAFPRFALFAVAHQQIARLLEIRADQVAARHHAPWTWHRRWSRWPPVAPHPPARSPPRAGTPSSGYTACCARPHRCPGAPGLAWSRRWPPSQCCRSPPRPWHGPSRCSPPASHGEAPTARRRGRCSRGKRRRGRPYWRVATPSR